jgi:hypothetical protein
VTAFRAVAPAAPASSPLVIPVSKRDMVLLKPIGV